MEMDERIAKQKAAFTRSNKELKLLAKARKQWSEEGYLAPKDLAEKSVSSQRFQPTLRALEGWK